MISDILQLSLAIFPVWFVVFCLVGVAVILVVTIFKIIGVVLDAIPFL